VLVTSNVRSYDDMSLFRTAIILSLGIAVLPSDKAQQERLYQQAAGAAHWTVTFCDRNGQTCDNATALWAVFVRKAEFAGKLAYDMAQRYAAGETTAAAPASFERDAATVQPMRGTLTPDDLRPAWRGSATRQGI
jgi:hypothetical protein